MSQPSCPHVLYICIDFSHGDGIESEDTEAQIPADVLLGTRVLSRCVLGARLIVAEGCHIRFFAGRQDPDLYRKLRAHLKVPFERALDYVSRRYRQQQDLDPEVPVTVCLHLDEYQQAGTALAKKLAAVPGQFLTSTAGAPSEAAKARVVLLPILTGLTRDVCITHPISSYAVGARCVNAR
jgi:hypothetical protein